MNEKMKNQTEANEKQLERLLSEAAAVARNYRSAELRADHLLYVISGSEEGRRVIEGMGGRPRKIRRFLESTFEFNAGSVRSAPGRPEIGESLQATIHAPVVEARASGTPVTFRALLRQMLHLGDACHVTREALRSGGLLERDWRNRDEDFRIPEEVEQALEADDDTEASSDDMQFGLDLSDLDDVEETACESVPSRPGQAGVPSERGASAHEADRAQAAAEKPVEICEHEKAAMAAMRDLTAAAQAGQIDDVVGREEIIERVVDTLCRRTKRNTILAGEPGVGKTAIAEGLALRMSSGEVPEQLASRPLLEVSLSDLVAGARFRGDFEARMGKLVEIARARRAVLFIDEMHMIVGAGATGAKGGMDASNILKPALARGEISVIGATTPGEMREIRKDGALMRRFQVEAVLEPSTAETREIIDQAVGSYVLHHEILFEDDMLDAVVALADRYLPQRRFPDKAFDLIDTACVIARRAAEPRVRIEHLRGAIHRLGGPRLGTPDPERVVRVKELEPRLNEIICGQEGAISELARGARISLMGLQPGGTAGSYLLNGPTGTGKSAMAEAFAAQLDLPLVRISMSEFIEKHSVSRLIGAPPGYVGYEEEGLLTRAGEMHPEFVLLLDEIEKAHPDIFDILLQVLDTGVLRAGDGREISLAGAHVIFTANIGAADAERNAIGFGRATDNEEIADDAVKRLFRKEFLARIQKRVQFARIGQDVLRRIATLELAKEAARLADSGIEVSFDESVAEDLAEKALNDAYAVRSLKLRIKDDVSDLLVEEILSSGGAGSLHVGLSDGKLKITSR